MLAHGVIDILFYKTLIATGHQSQDVLEKNTIMPCALCMGRSGHAPDHWWPSHLVYMLHVGLTIRNSMPCRFEFQPWHS